MAERVRITGKNDGVSNNEAIDAQVDSTFSALHTKSHLYGSDGIGFNNPVKADSSGALNVVPANIMVSVPFTTTTVQAVGSTDVSIYRAVAVQILTQGTSSTVTFQGSNDNTNWVSIALTISTSVATAPVVSTTAASSYYGPLHFKYFRLNVTGISAGTTAGVITFSSIYPETNVMTSSSVTATISTSGSVLYSDSTTNLGANAAYTGTSRDNGSTAGYNRFVARVFANQAGTLSIQDSSDNTNWFTISSVAVVANVCNVLDIQITSRYNRVYYLNGADATTSIRITSALKRI